MLKTMHLPIVGSVPIKCGYIVSKRYKGVYRLSYKLSNGNSDIRSASKNAKKVVMHLWYAPQECQLMVRNT